MRAIIALFVVVFVCGVKANCRNTAYNFHMCTWNSHGARWPIVRDIMADPTIDVMAIQESGSVPRGGDDGTIANPEDGSRKLHIRSLNFIGNGPERGDSPAVIEEWLWQTTAGNFYLYYYDRKIRQLKGGATTTAQNLAIVSKTRASELFYMKPIDRAGNEIAVGGRRYWINRPLIGISVDCQVYFTAHPEPNDERNEAPAIVALVQDYMATHHSTTPWALLSDFNRQPSTLDAQLNAMGANPPANTFRQTVYAGVPTRNVRRARELDYAVIGGPESLANRIHLNAEVYEEVFRNQVNPSDHKPIKIN